MSQDTIVFDAGSYTTKAGFASEAFPRAVFPSAVARFRRLGLLDGLPIVYCGKEAILNRGLSKLTWPVQEGFITDWDEMEKLWHHVFYKELQVAPESARVMHSVHPLVSDRDKEKMAEILFESFTVEGLYLMKAPVLSLHASGRTTGVVWEGGFSCSYVAPVFEGFPLRHATLLSPLTGEMLTKRLQKLLFETGYSFTTPLEIDLLNDIKANHCYIPPDYEAELDACACSGENKLPYKLPDGQQVFLGNERIRCPEILFNPSLDNLGCLNIPDLISSSVLKCDIDYRSVFYENIVVAGGSSMITGLVDRLKVDLTNLLRNKQRKVNVDAMSSRLYATWLGGSVLASMENLKGFWMTKEEYDDGGPERVKYKFF